jgi:hypothetical protein
VLLKELAAVARTLTFEPVAPATSERDVGEAESEKLGADAAETVVATVAEWLRFPEVPVKVMVALPDAAEDAAVSVTVCAVPGVKVGVAGLAVTPDGSPATETLTVPVKPFCGAAFTLTAWPAPPAVSVTVAGVEVSEKFGDRGGMTAECDPPPQESRVKSENRHAVRQAVRVSFENLMISVLIACVCCECECCFGKRPPAVKRANLSNTLDAGFWKRVAMRRFCLEFRYVAGLGQTARGILLWG